jgi:hypothetical protein
VARVPHVSVRDMVCHQRNCVKPSRSQQTLFHPTNPAHPNNLQVIHRQKIVGIVVMLNLLSLRLLSRNKRLQGKRLTRKAPGSPDGLPGWGGSPQPFAFNPLSPYSGIPYG